MAPREIARRTLRSRLLAAHPSRARRQELLGDMRGSPGRAKFETHDAGECIKRHTTQTLAGRGHRKRTLRQRPMPSPTPQPHSLTPLHGAPALRHGGRRRINLRPPPRSRPSRSRRPRSRTAAVRERRHAPPPHVRPAHARAGAQRRRQRHPLPVIGPPALPGAARAADLPSSTRAAKKTICKVVLFIFLAVRPSYLVAYRRVAPRSDGQQERLERALT